MVTWTHGQLCLCPCPPAVLVPVACRTANCQHPRPAPVIMNEPPDSELRNKIIYSSNFTNKISPDLKPIFLDHSCCQRGGSKNSVFQGLFRFREVPRNTQRQHVVKVSCLVCHGDPLQNSSIRRRISEKGYYKHRSKRQYWQLETI